MRGRRKTERARHLVERVLPQERVRQWLRSLPFALRWPLAFHRDVPLAHARIAQQEIEHRYRRLARQAGLRGPRGGRSR
jgi:hypothetical protein